MNFLIFANMENSGNYVSRFGREEPAEDFAIDFSKAEKMDTCGSCCEAYIMRHHRRKVFVKRLKEEFSNSSIHLAALDKEFEVGVNLKHPSLPTYLECHKDYIVMDFIEGDSLSSLISNNDSWLKNKRNVWLMLKELLSVIGYLHRNHVVHCDIKPDNIILTRDERRLFLIDLDKCHTDWMDDTSGSPALYGLDKEMTANTDFDFHGVGLIVDCLTASFPSLKGREISRLKDKCLKKGINDSQLINYINRQLRSSKEKYVYTTLFAIIMALSAVLIYVLINYKSLYTASKIGERNRDTIKVVEKIVQMPDTHQQIGNNVLIPSKNENLYDTKMDKLRKIIEKEYPVLAAPISKEMDIFYEKVKEGGLTDDQLHSEMGRLNTLPFNQVDSLGISFSKKYPEFKPSEVIKIIVESQAYYELGQKQKRAFNLYLDTIMQRTQKLMDISFN